MERVRVPSDRIGDSVASVQTMVSMKDPGTLFVVSDLGLAGINIGPILGKMSCVKTTTAKIESEFKRERLFDPRDHNTGPGKCKRVGCFYVSDCLIRNAALG